MSEYDSQSTRPRDREKATEVDRLGLCRSGECAGGGGLDELTAGWHGERFYHVDIWRRDSAL